ncbi:MAG: hypothetical protein JNK82_25615 [Myxococcaceae bacterium]|nr:hypothetical protein [Myxococcaceae bacterium]
MLIILAVANPYLEEGRRLATELKFAEAIEQLKVARQVPGQREAEQAEVLDLLARCYAAEGRRGEAQATYEALLVVEPSFAPDRSLSPKILEAFDSAKEKVFPKEYLKLVPLAAPPGLARLRVVDPWQRASSYALRLRVDTDEVWSVTPLTPEQGLLTVELAGAPLRTLEWFVTAFDARGEPVAGYGTAEAPQRHTVPMVAVGTMTVRETPRIQRWPAWVAVGLGVAAVIVGAVFQVNAMSRARLLDDRSMPPGDWADTAREAHALSARDATLGTSLFVVAAIASGVGAAVFAW